MEKGKYAIPIPRKISQVKATPPANTMLESAAFSLKRYLEVNVVSTGRSKAGVETEPTMYHRPTTDWTNSASTTASAATTQTARREATSPASELRLASPSHRSLPPVMAATNRYDSTVDITTANIVIQK